MKCTYLKLKDEKQSIIGPTLGFFQQLKKSPSLQKMESWSEKMYSKDILAKLKLCVQFPFLTFCQLSERFSVTSVMRNFGQTFNLVAKKLAQRLLSKEYLACSGTKCASIL